MSLQFASYQGDLDAIRSMLQKKFLPEHRELKQFSSQLEKIDISIEKALNQPNIQCKKNLEKQQKLVRDLSGRCHQLEVRRDVIEFAENAEDLANSSVERPQEDIALDANNLRNRMENFLISHRPSRTNSKFIRFARLCIAKAEKKEPVLIRGEDGRLRKVISIETFKSKEVTMEMFDLAESLYALGSLLYFENLDEFCKTLATKYSEATQKEILFHVSVSKGNLDDLNNKELRLRTIQGILGYAHEITDYYMDETPYPTLTEIHRLYKDIELLSHTEEGDPSPQ